MGKIIQRLEAGQDLFRSGYKVPEANYRLGSNCLVFEHRVVVSSTLREAILQELHAAHLGIVKMKGMARSFVFWPGIDADIEAIARTCTAQETHTNHRSTVLIIGSIPRVRGSAFTLITQDL